MDGWPCPWGPRLKVQLSLCSFCSPHSDFLDIIIFRELYIVMDHMDKTVLFWSLYCNLNVFSFTSPMIQGENIQNVKMRLANRTSYNMLCSLVLFIMKSMFSRRVSVYVKHLWVKITFLRLPSQIICHWHCSSFHFSPLWLNLMVFKWKNKFTMVRKEKRPGFYPR